MGGQYSDGDPVTGALNAGGVGRNRDSKPISGFTVWDHDNEFAIWQHPAM